MHSCPKKTSEAMFDWMATTALKTLINTIISTFTDIQEYSLGCLFLFQKYKVHPVIFLISSIHFTSIYKNIKSILIQDKSFDLNHLQNDKNNDIFD